MNQPQFEILIIDDDPSFTKLLKLRLKSVVPGALFSCFSNLEDARMHLGSHPAESVDLVVLDQHLPDGKGIELLNEGWFGNQAVLAVSSDDAPEIPGASLQAGATYFLNKKDISQPLFKPLVQGIVDWNRIQRELQQARGDAAVIETVKTLVGTLRHEINNPLGAVLGAAYLLENSPEASPEQREAAQLVESSGKRIKHVLDQLCDAIELQPVTKGQQKVFHIPGDKPWDEGEC